MGRTLESDRRKSKEIRKDIMETVKGFYVMKKRVVSELENFEKKHLGALNQDLNKVKKKFQFNDVGRYYLTKEEFEELKRDWNKLKKEIQSDSNGKL